VSQVCCIIEKRVAGYHYLSVLPVIMVSRQASLGWGADVTLKSVTQSPA
jgi:hypothetical protein